MIVIALLLKLHEWTEGISPRPCRPSKSLRKFKQNQTDASENGGAAPAKPLGCSLNMPVNNMYIHRQYFLNGRGTIPSSWRMPFVTCGDKLSQPVSQSPCCSDVGHATAVLSDFDPYVYAHYVCMSAYRSQTLFWLLSIWVFMNDTRGFLQGPVDP